MTLAALASKNLKAARQTAGISQQALAQKTALSVSYISMLERGLRTPPLDTLETLAKALRCSLISLLSRN